MFEFDSKLITFLNQKQINYMCHQIEILNLFVYSGEMITHHDQGMVLA